MTDWKKEVSSIVREGKLSGNTNGSSEKAPKKPVPIGLLAAGAIVGGVVFAAYSHNDHSKPNASPSTEASATEQASQSVVVKPSFDCAKASKPQEKLICSDPELAKLDADLADAYRKARDAAPDRASVLASQRAWIKQSFNACNDKACLTSAYQSRLAELAQGGGAVSGSNSNEPAEQGSGNQAVDRLTDQLGPSGWAQCMAGFVSVNAMQIRGDDLPKEFYNSNDSLGRALDAVHQKLLANNVPQSTLDNLVRASGQRVLAASDPNLEALKISKSCFDEAFNATRR